MLTQRQKQLLEFIEVYEREHGVPPSFDEMRESLRLRSKSGIHRLVSALEERGYIRRLAYRARALEIVRLPGQAARDLSTLSPLPAQPTSAMPLGPNVVRGQFKRIRAAPRQPLGGSGGHVDIPVYGRIAAGTPIEALAEGNVVMDVPTALVGEGEHYVLQVAGDSMIEAGIDDGDWVVIQRCDEAPTGTIVVALIDDREATLKRLRLRGASIALEAANPAYETRIFGPHRVKVQGRLVGLMRRY